MKKIMTRAAETALAAGVAGGVLLLGSSVAGAQEAEPPTTAEGDGFVAGNAVNADVDVPVTLCGLAGSVLGVATGVCEDPPVPPPSQDTTVAQASGSGTGTGNAVGLDVDAPITVCGLGVVGGGVATGVCEGAPAAAPAAGGGDTTVAKAEGDGFITGNAIGVDVDVPITVCGVGGALLGVATGTCAMAPPPPGGPGGLGDTVVAEGSGNGFLAGNALGLNLDLPINICGVGVAVGGVAVGECSMPAPLATTGPDSTSSTAEGNGFLAGNAIAGDFDVPITACGVGGVGLGVATGVCDVGPPTPPPPCDKDCPPPPCDKDCPPPPCDEDCPPPPCDEDCPPPPCDEDCPPPPCDKDCPPPPCDDDCPPPPCDDDCPPPPCDEDCPPPPPPPPCEVDCPPPPQHRMKPHAHPVGHRGGAGAAVSELPRTGGPTDVALPLGTGLVAAGMAFMAAARRRMARAAG